MKKIIYILLTIIAIFLIYLNYDRRIYNYVSIGDFLINNANNIRGSYNDYVKDYLVKSNKLGNYNNLFYNNSIKGLINDLKDNKTIIKDNKEYYFKKVLRESDIVIVSIGMESIIHNYDKYDMNKNYRYFDKLFEDIKNLVQEIKKYAQGNIIFLGYYNPTNYYDSKTDELFFDLDIKINNLLEPLDIIYIDLYDMIKSNQFKDNKKEYLLNTYGNKRIADIIAYYLE